ncbi:MAG: putative importin subunit alpha-2 [Streblomastix strix]|uniref:Putative importin subunit alpha-2 n=1 Tax=Streblomastix strix TaxID=222440 RepID=A0A5J4VHG3_9EUKA|nr:MAG: putative importin subunit alpha-2 [Streblomastix strix]
MQFQPLSAAERAQKRQTTYNQEIDNVGTRRQRVDDRITLRKANRGDFLSRKRAEFLKLEKIDAALSEQGKAIIAQLDDIVEKLNSENIDEILQSVRLIRKLLSSNEKVIPIQHIINSGAPEKFSSLLARDDLPKVQEELIWILTNMFSGTVEEAENTVKFGVVPHLVRFLASPTAKFREYSAWAIANIAFEKNDYLLNTLIDANLEDQLLKLLVKQSQISPFEGSKIILMDEAQREMRNQVYMLSNIVTNINLKPETLKAAASLFITYLVNIIDNEKNTRQILDALYGLNQIIDNEQVQNNVTLSGAVSKIARFINNKDFQVSNFALHIIGSLAAGNEMQAQVIITSGALVNILSLLSQIPPIDQFRLNQQKMSINDALHILQVREDNLKEVCWMLSNLAAGTLAQATAVINSGCVQKIILLLFDAEVDKGEKIFFPNEQSDTKELEERYIITPPISELEFEQKINQDNKLNADNDNEEEELPLPIAQTRRMYSSSYQQWTVEAFFVLANCTAVSVRQAAQIGKLRVIPLFVKWLDSKKEKILNLILFALDQIFAAGRAFTGYDKDHSKLKESSNINLQSNKGIPRSLSPPSVSDVSNKHFSFSFNSQQHQSQSCSQSSLFTQSVQFGSSWQQDLHQKQTLALQNIQMTQNTDVGKQPTSTFQFGSSQVQKQTSQIQLQQQQPQRLQNDFFQNTKPRSNFFKSYNQFQNPFAKPQSSVNQNILIDSSLQTEDNEFGSIFEKIFFEADGVEKLDQLQRHKSERIFKLAKNLIEKYFPDDDENEDITENS